MPNSEDECWKPIISPHLAMDLECPNSDDVQTSDQQAWYNLVHISCFNNVSMSNGYLNIRLISLGITNQDPDQGFVW